MMTTTLPPAKPHAASAPPDRGARIRMDAPASPPRPSGDTLGARRGAFLDHGSLSVPASGEADFEAAEKYLRRDSMMAAIFDRAERGTRRLTLDINAHDDDSFDPNTDTVHWDPHSALRTTEGGTQTPALGLGHELDHATVDPAIGARGSAKFDAAYDNAEERRVITGSEAHAAKTLGEGLRYDHAGTTYHVHSPTER